MFLLKSRNGQHQLKLKTIKQRNVQWSSEKWTHNPLFNTLWTILKMLDQMQVTPIPPYSNRFYQLVSGCTQRLFFWKGPLLLAYHLPIYLASATFFLCINLHTYMATYSSNLSTLFFELLFYLLNCLLTQLPTYIPTYLTMHWSSYLPLCSPTYLCFLHAWNVITICILWLNLKVILLTKYLMNITPNFQIAIVNTSEALVKREF